MLAQETVLEKLREWMEELFEIAPEDVQRILSMTQKKGGPAPA